MTEVTNMGEPMAVALARLRELRESDYPIERRAFDDVRKFFKKLVALRIASQVMEYSPEDESRLRSGITVGFHKEHEGDFEDPTYTEAAKTARENLQVLARDKDKGGAGIVQVLKELAPAPQGRMAAPPRQGS